MKLNALTEPLLRLIENEKILVLFLLSSICDGTFLRIAVNNFQEKELNLFCIHRSSTFLLMTFPTLNKF